MAKITASAPMRVDFAGGTIDLPPLFLFHYPAPTVNAAVNIKARVSVEPSEKYTIRSLDQNVEATWESVEAIDWTHYPMLELACRLVKSFNPSPVTVEITSEAPAGSGIGGSSVIAIALTAALAKQVGRQLSEKELVEHAKSIETQTIKVPTGYQDYWGAVYGGIHAFIMGLDGNLELNPLGSAEFRRQLQEQMMLVYVGKPHFSGMNNWQLFKDHIDNANGVPEFFEKLKEHGVRMHQAFNNENLEEIAAVLNDDWQTRKTMLPTMTTPEIELLIEKTFAAGAYAARVCGAGAGGCTLLLVKPEQRAAVEQAVQSLNMQLLDSSISEQGVQVQVD